MQDDAFSRLITHIRDHCKRNEWFGPDADNPRSRGRYQLIYGFDSWDKAPPLDTGGAEYRRMYDPRQNANVVVIGRHTDPRRHNFAHPPATEQQLQDTEAALGFPLPPLLRVLYAQLANGGFGPSCGIIGTPGGFSLEVGMGSDIVAAYHSDTMGMRALDLADYEEEMRSQGFVDLPLGTYPTRLLRLAYEGCAITYDIHLDSGSRVLVTWRDT